MAAICDQWTIQNENTAFGEKCHPRADRVKTRRVIRPSSDVRGRARRPISFAVMARSSQTTRCFDSSSSWRVACPAECAIDLATRQYALADALRLTAGEHGRLPRRGQRRQNCRCCSRRCADARLVSKSQSAARGSREVRTSLRTSWQGVARTHLACDQVTQGSRHVARAGTDFC